MLPKIARLVLVLFLPAAEAAADQCVDLDGRFRSALQQNKLESGKALLKKLQTACPNSVQLKSAERYYTDVIARRANDLVNRNRVKAGEALLDQAKTLSWSVSTVRGDIAAKRKNWKEAAQQYGQAYELLTDPTHATTSEIPNLQAIQERIYQLAMDAQLVYGKLDVSVTRSGKPQGILSRAGGGSGVRKTALPIHFEMGKANLTTDGMEAADALADFLLGLSGKITLIGFADPRGNEQTNLELSRQRAQTVAAYLAGKGVRQPMEAMGKGASEPPKTLLENLTEEEQYARWRRVELQIEP